MTNVDNPELAISVIIESSDGSAKAVNVAKQVLMPITIRKEENANEVL